MNNPNPSQNKEIIKKAVENIQGLSTHIRDIKEPKQLDTSISFGVSYLRDLQRGLTGRNINFLLSPPTSGEITAVSTPSRSRASSINTLTTVGSNFGSNQGELEEEAAPFEFSPSPLTGLKKLPSSLVPTRQQSLTIGPKTGIQFKGGRRRSTHRQKRRRASTHKRRRI